MPLSPEIVMLDSISSEMAAVLLRPGGAEIAVSRFELEGWLAKLQLTVALLALREASGGDGSLAR
jgi:hypothetical protein